MSASCATLKLGLLGSRTRFSKLHHHHPRSRCGLGRRDLAFRGIAVVAAVMAPSKSQGLEKLAYKPEGYTFWRWRDRKIHYVVEGEGNRNGIPIVLIHGFGASAFHWRYNIPELAKNYKVYALDLLGFGWSEKALIDYDALVWRDQVVDFVRVVQEPAVLVGNSLGGFTALVAAEALQDQVEGVVLLNSAGQFGDTITTTTESEENLLQKFVVKPVKEVLSKQPARIESVLKSPADDPNAGEVYYRLMSRFMSNQRKYTLDSVLSQLSCPLLLVWGDLVPWVGPGKALRIKEFYRDTWVVNLQAGHCPHDEVPELVNKALLEWLSTLTTAPSLQPL